MNNKYPSYNHSDGSPATFPPVTPYMVRARAIELAISAGRSSIEIRQSDYEQAKRELTGETDFDRQQTVLFPTQYPPLSASGAHDDNSFSLSR